jgi:NodT family efflux transporter outer membrane factor (OMF) lipoprotein
MQFDQAALARTASSAPNQSTQAAPTFKLRLSPIGGLVIGSALLLTCGCTSISDYVHNGFKVGPNYERPPAPVEKTWIDGDDVRIRTESDDLSAWWKVFNDPALDSLICLAYQQNLTLREASFRVLEARAQLGIAVGNLFPQTQAMTGSYTRNAISVATANTNAITSGKRWFQQWNYGFNLAWEIDFWGRLRRAVEASEATLDASIEDYDDVLVTLLGDVATNYVQLRTFEQRIVYAKSNVEIQRETLKIVEGGFKAGTVNELDVSQARSTLEQTEADIPALEAAARLVNNQLCILLGIPPEDLHAKLGTGPIPTAPTEVAAGIPAELLRRRPDIRRAERQAAAQSALIGFTEAEFYPHISFNGTMSWSAQRIKDLIQERSVTGTLGPAFTWNILNYGRILNDVRFQDARFQELVAAYQNAVLAAQREVENGLVTFTKAQERAKLQGSSVTDAEKAVKIALAQYTAGVIDLTRVTLLQQTLVQQQDTLAQAQGDIGLGLVQVYEALGGGWQLRLTGCEPGPLPPPNAATDKPASSTPTPSKDKNPTPAAPDKMRPPVRQAPKLPDTNKIPPAAVPDKRPPLTDTSVEAPPADAAGGLRRLSDLFR